MRILLVGAGGVGAAMAAIAARRDFFDALVIADIDPERARRAAQRTGDRRVTGARVDAGNRAEVVGARPLGPAPM